MTVMTDEQIVQLLREGQAAAADELYKKHAKSLYVYLSHVLNVPNPEDAVHDIFVRVIEKAHQFNPKKASFRTWLFRIAHTIPKKHLSGPGCSGSPTITRSMFSDAKSW